jgi:hypothetical protein
MGTKAITQDLINWMDHCEPGWRSLEPGRKQDLLRDARRYWLEVARRYAIPETDYGLPLVEAEEMIRSDNSF